MTSPEFEAFLARVYVDAEFRRSFLAAPVSTARQAGLSESECQALADIDQEGLGLAASSFAAKRKKAGATPRKRWWQ